MNIKDYYMRDYYIEEKTLEYIAYRSFSSLHINTYIFRLTKDRYDKFYIDKNLSYRECYLKDRLISVAIVKI